MLSSKILQWFPPPSFLAMRGVGVSIDEAGLTYLKLDASKFGAKITIFGSEPFPEGTIQNGHVAAPNEVARVLRRANEEYALEFIRTAIPEDLSFIIPLQVPVVGHDEIRQYLENHIEEYVPLRQSNIVFDYVRSMGAIVPPNHSALVVSAVSRKVSDAYAKMISGAGLLPLSFEPDVQAVARAVVSFDESETVVCVDIRKNRTAIFVVAEGIVRFATSVGCGEEFFEQQLLGHTGISREVVQEIKKSRDVSVGPYASAMAQSVRELALALGKHTEEHIMYWKTHRLSQTLPLPKRIIMSGTALRIGGLFEYIAEKMPLPAVLANPWENVFVGSGRVPPVSAREQFGYTTAIGCALVPFAREKGLL